MKAFIIVILLVFSFSVQAQKNQVLKLKNGSEIRGQVVSVDTNGTALKTKDGSVLIYPSDEIASIERFIPKVSGKGFYLRAESGIVGGSQVSPSIQIINGYSFNSHWDLGLGIGFEHYWGDWYIPITTNMRYNLFNKASTPFVDVIAGYQMPMTDFGSNDGGFTTGAKVGFTHGLGDRISFSTSVGYRFAYLQETNQWWDDWTTIREIHRFELKFGITFK